MPMGPGIYDDVATRLREELQAEGVVVLIINGNKGNGFSAQVTGEHLLSVSGILRGAADEFDQAIFGGKRVS